MRTGKSVRGKKGQRGERGIPGPPGPAGPQGEIGEKGFHGSRGPRGRVGARGLAGALGPAVQIKNFQEMIGQLQQVDRSVDHIYQELGVHISRMTQLQRELDSLRATVRQLAAHGLEIGKPSRKPTS
jgi:hypothetical protein